MKGARPARGYHRRSLAPPENETWGRIMTRPYGVGPVVRALLSRQAQSSLRHDITLNLRGAAFDRVGDGAQVLEFPAAFHGRPLAVPRELAVHPHQPYSLFLYP